ncbi:unnamed protein product [Trifolium pratense]|uniref:Uncharacterized protein n=1 Tax=Trifolium pratense TaxID=57577 RepID=A0ACB0JKJ8_TRIPR|nr:unnamed protein product [Trifolium pratense]
MLRVVAEINTTLRVRSTTLRVVAEINTTPRVIDITPRVITSQWPIFSGQSFTSRVTVPTPRVIKAGFWSLCDKHHAARDGPRP